MTNIPEGPFFVAPVRNEISGIDFLALGAVGERLITAGLPGITNVTRYLRPYTFAAWIVWRFNENLKALSGRGEKLPAHPRALFKAFREKAELMFSWCNKGTVAAIGNSRNYPNSSNSVILSFSNEIFGPTNQASWFAAAAYGPSFSEANGLGYIRAYKAIYVSTPLGKKAAEVMDHLMQSHPAAQRRIGSLLDHHGSLRDVTALESALRLDSTTAAERTLFRTTLYPEALVGTWDMGHGNRASTIALILELEALRLGKRLDEEGIRQAIALGRTADGKEISDPRLARMRRLWFALSLRQLERVALERLLRWFELRLFERLGQWCDVDTLCSELTSALEGEFAESGHSKVRDRIAKVRKEIADAGGIWRCALSDGRLSQFATRRALEDLPESHSREIPAKAISALLFCSSMVELCQEEPWLPEMLRMGGRERVSLSTLAHFVHSRSDGTVLALGRDVLVHFVYAQHLQTAASRAEEGKNKFRFAIDDNGLRPLVPAASVNAQLGTPDRIRHALYLMVECNLVRCDKESRYAVS